MAATAVHSPSQLAADELAHLASALYQFMVATEQAGYGRFEERIEPLRKRARDLAQRFEQARNQMATRGAHLVQETTKNLKAMAHELEKHRPEPTELRARWAALGRNYEALFADLRRVGLTSVKGLTLGHLKPRNLARNLFHVANGVSAMLIYELWLTKAQALAIASTLLAVFASLDVARRLWPSLNEGMVYRAFNKISRPNEAHRIPSATWFLCGLLIGVLVLPKHAIALGALVLALGDPAASLAGKTWGTKKLLAEKSVAGTAAFLAVATLATAVFLIVVMPALPAWRVALIAAAVGGAGAITELVSRRVDDNLTIPLCCGTVAALLC